MSLRSCISASASASIWSSVSASGCICPAAFSSKSMSFPIRWSPLQTKTLVYTEAKKTRSKKMEEKSLLTVPWWTHKRRRKWFWYSSPRAENLSVLGWFPFPFQMWDVGNGDEDGDLKDLRMVLIRQAMKWRKHILRDNNLHTWTML